MIEKVGDVSRRKSYFEIDVILRTGGTKKSESGRRENNEKWKFVGLTAAVIFQS